MPGNDDAFLFAGKEPDWTYAYYICLTGGDNCPEWTTKAPTITEPTLPYTECSESAEDIMAILTTSAQSLTLEDFNWNCVEFSEPEGDLRRRLAVVDAGSDNVGFLGAKLHFYLDDTLEETLSIGQDWNSEEIGPGSQTFWDDSDADFSVHFNEALNVVEGVSSLNSAFEERKLGLVDSFSEKFY